MKIKTRTVKMIDVQEWDDLVQKTYGRPYSFQQQEGCKERGTFNLTVPDQDNDEDMADSVPEEVNGEEMGVKFASWLARSPKKKLKGQTASYQLDLWWERNFYPDVQAVANDLHAKGLLDAGNYVIDIDW
jgi:hypothetical protein